jgi:hypothetical protein
LVEGENLLFVAENVGVLKVYALFLKDEPRGGLMNFTVLAYIHGESLESDRVMRSSWRRDSFENLSLS